MYFHLLELVASKKEKEKIISGKYQGSPPAKKKKKKKKKNSGPYLQNEIIIPKLKNTLSLYQHIGKLAKKKELMGSIILAPLKLT